MVKVEMIKKLRDKNNKLYGYIIRDEYGRETGIYTSDLKKSILNGSCVVSNMTLTSDGRLIEKKMSVVSDKNNLLIPSIFGVQIKNIKTSVGREGEYYKGNVYYMGKLLGEWSQDPNGCIVDNYYFDESILKTPLAKYKNAYGAQNSMETFMLKVVILTEYYKLYQKMLKAGNHDKMTVVTDDYDCSYIVITYKNKDSKTKISIDRAAAQIAKNNMGLNVKEFNKEEDFCIN